MNDKLSETAAYEIIGEILSLARKENKKIILKK